MDPIQNVIVSAQMTDIPQSIKSSQATKPIPSDMSRYYSLNPTSGSNAGAGSIIQFQIPPQSNAFLKAGSVYLKFTFTQPLRANNTNVNYANGSQDCSSMFNRVSTFIGGTQLEINQNYDFLNSLLLSHVSGSSYALNDLVVMSKMLGTGGSALGTANISSPQVMPLLCGWCNSDQNFPLCLLKEPILISFDVNNSGRALLQTDALVNGFSLTNIQLCYETVRVDNQYVQALRDQINSGKLYSMNFITPLGLQFSGAIGSTTYNAGLGLSSIRGIAIHPIVDLTLSASNTVKAASRNGLSNARFYIDGNLVNNFNLEDSVHQYASLNNTFGNLFSRTSCSVRLNTDDGITSPGTALSRTAYESHVFAVGVGTEKFNEKGLSFAGTQCSNLQVILDGLSAVATEFMFVFHDTLLIIAADGSSSIVR